MEENKQKQNDISIMEIFYLLLSKFKLLILIVVLAVLAGGGFGYLQTYDVEYYGAEMKFYINPYKEKGTDVNSDSQYGIYGAYNKNVLNNIVELLESEAFAERLLLDDNGLPKEADLQRLNDYDLYSKVYAAQGVIAEYDALYQSMALAFDDLNKDNAELAEVTNTLSLLWTNEVKTKDAYSRLGYTPRILTEEDSFIPEDIRNKVNEAIEKRNYLNSTSIPQKQNSYDNLYASVSALAAEVEEAKKPALERWRAIDSTYKGEIAKRTSAVKYSYYDKTEDASADDLARSFIYVNISVLNNEEFAKELRDTLEEEVPKYVVEKMPLPSGYSGTNCIRISRMDAVQRTNGGVVRSTAIKYGLIFGAGAFLLACIVIIIVDRSDKRLRSVEQITDVFNVPVLGVIPSFKDEDRAKNIEDTEDIEDNIDETSVEEVE